MAIISTDITPPACTKAERQEHASYVRRLFATIPAHYDRLNRLISLGQDQAWRRYAVSQCALPEQGWMLDVATGTGDILLQALEQYPDASVLGLDLTPGMLQRAREKNQQAMSLSLPLLGGDGQDLPFPDDRFDAVISSFMVRNVADVQRAFAEQRRVVRPGGRVVCLEITQPQRWPYNWIFWAYFYGLVPLIGTLLSGRPEAYTYLPRSVARFLSADEVQLAMEQVGLRQVRYRLLKMNSVAVHVGVK